MRNRDGVIGFPHLGPVEIGDIEHVGICREEPQPITARQVVMWVAIGVGIAAGHLGIVAVLARLG